MLFPISGVGNLTSDAEVTKTTEKSKFVKFSVAASERVQNKEGAWEDRPSFYPVKIRLPLNSTLDKYLVRGQTVFITGVLYQERWEKDGQKQSMLVIECSSPGHGVSLVGPKKSNTSSDEGSVDTKNTPKNTPRQDDDKSIDVANDEIPF